MERVAVELVQLRQELARVTATRDRYQAKGKELLAQHRALQDEHARLQLAFYRLMNEVLEAVNAVDDENGPFFRHMKHIFDCIERSLW